jgi:hypothetical protein
MSNHHGPTRLFPRSWRTRYGKEVADLVEDMKSDEHGFRLRDRIDLARAGISERGAVIWHRGALSPRIVALRVVTAGLALILVLGSALLVGGVLEGQSRPSPSRVVTTGTPARLVALPGASSQRLGIMTLTRGRLVALPERAQQVEVVVATSMRLVALPNPAQQGEVMIATPTRLVSVPGETSLSRSR